MAHLPRFHRRKKDAATPTLITSDLPGKTLAPTTTTTVTASAVTTQPRAASPMRSLQKLSPFRVFQRTSGKRARDSPPASMPHSPAAAPSMVLADGTDGRPVSPLSLKTDRASDDEGRNSEKQPKMPSFLQLSEHEIENKFLELVWRERHRMMQAVANPSPDFRWARVKGPHLRVLDRYINIQPWLNNRVKLQVPEGRLDYINASPIVLYPSGDPDAEPDRYIAMQGPKQVSTDHVWRMMVEQLESPGVIVMLTETHEGPQEKCYPYFPRSPEDPPLEVNERDEFGDGFRATVRCEGLEETSAGDAIELRKLVIRVHSRPKPPTTSDTAADPLPTTPPSTAGETEKSDNPDVEMTCPPSSSTSEEPPQPQSRPSSSSSSQPVQEKIVYHFLYKKWPDFGVPSLDDLDSFFTLMRLSRERNGSPRNPRVVHCSAGVGRSGTFIALEYLMRELESGMLADWDGSVAKVREEGAWEGLEVGKEGGGEEEEGEGSGRRAMDGNEAGSSSPSSTSSCLDKDEKNGARNELRPAARGEDLVFETVNALREQRRTMVQAESQYQFIYQVLRKLWMDKYGAAAAGDRMEEDASRSCSSHDGEPAAKRQEVEPPSSS
ncbi:hypothetical protein VTJ49DRAFT_5396 [Mycothermus thermophilus]|uniref:Uncharacterized protein n=1 Tax=Humicola insolens TaxID=85995 RepID=A0ABR3V381_HUMIN